MNRAPSDVVRLFWRKVWTDGDTDLLREIFHPQMVKNAEPVDITAFQDAVTRLRRTFPDFKVEIEELLDLDDDRVLTRVAYTGTQQQPWAGLPATGRAFSVLGIDIFTVKGGQITQLWHSVDHYDMATQLGAKLVLEDPEHLGVV